MNITDSNVDEWGVFRSFPIKYLDYTDNWLLEKAYSLNGFPLTVSTFERYPTMWKNIPKYFAETQYARGMKMSGYGGIDGFLLGNIADEMEFTVNIITPDDNYTYGFEQNGQYTGTLGDVIYGRADFAFNSRFLINYGTTHIEYMSPISGDKVCVIKPATKQTPQWKAIFNCFDIYFWYAFLLITAVSSIIFPMLKYYQEKQERRRIHDSMLYRDYKNIVVEQKFCVKNSIFFSTWQVMIGMNSMLPFTTVERLLIGSCMLANIIIGGSFEVCSYWPEKKINPLNIQLKRTC